MPKPGRTELFGPHKDDLSPVGPHKDDLSLVGPHKDDLSPVGPHKDDLSPVGPHKDDHEDDRAGNDLTKAISGRRPQEDDLRKMTSGTVEHPRRMKRLFA